MMASRSLLYARNQITSNRDLIPTPKTEFDLYTSKNGDFRFRLVAGNGQTILASEGYKTKASAENGIASVGKNSRRNGAFETFTGKNGKHYFKAANGQAIVSSQGYADTGRCAKDMESVQKNASAGVEDQA